MQTIPDAVLDLIVQHRPHMTQMIANLRAYPDQSRQIEKAIAQAYLAGESHLSAPDTWHLSQVYYGGPWGGDWITLARAAEETGYNHGTLRRMINDGKISGVKYGKTHYVRRGALSTREPPERSGSDADCRDASPR